MRTGPDRFYLLPGSLPGAGVGGPGALTGGENRLPPVGLIDFSVGAGGGGAGRRGGVSVTVFVTVTVSGAGASFRRRRRARPWQ